MPRCVAWSASVLRRLHIHALALGSANQVEVGGGRLHPRPPPGHLPVQDRQEAGRRLRGDASAVANNAGARCFAWRETRAPPMRHFGRTSSIGCSGGPSSITVCGDSGILSGSSYAGGLGVRPRVLRPAVGSSIPTRRAGIFPLHPHRISKAVLGNPGAFRALQALISLSAYKDSSRSHPSWGNTFRDLSNKRDSGSYFLFHLLICRLLTPPTALAQDNQPSLPVVPAGCQAPIPQSDSGSQKLSAIAQHVKQTLRQEAAGCM
eukprot:gene17040-biopygen1264